MCTTEATTPELISKQLTSSGSFHTPGIFRAMQNNYRAGRRGSKTRNHAIKTMEDGYSLTNEDAEGILSGSIPVEIDEAAGTVTFVTKE